MMEPFQQNQETRSLTEELKRIFLISLMALLLVGLSVLLDEPVTALAWILTAAGLLCLVYLVVASRSVLKNSQKPSQ
jgi:Flp pilus assembly protein TadB